MGRKETQQPKPSIKLVAEKYGQWGDAGEIPATGEASIHCLFHDDSTKSATIDVDRNLYHCFACGVSGDSFKLIMEMEGVDFIAAKRLAESQFGVQDGHIRKPAKQRYRPSWT